MLTCRARALPVSLYSPYILPSSNKWMLTCKAMALAVSLTLLLYSPYISPSSNKSMLTCRARAFPVSLGLLLYSPYISPRSNNNKWMLFMQSKSIGSFSAEGIPATFTASSFTTTVVSKEMLMMMGKNIFEVNVKQGRLRTWIRFKMCGTSPLGGGNNVSMVMNCSVF